MVEWADPDKVGDRHVDQVPNDPYYNQQFYLNNSGELYGVPIDIDAERAWDVTTGTSSIKVAVLDTGVDGGHPDLYCSGGLSGYDAFLGNPDGTYNPLPGDTHGTLVTGVFKACHNGVGTAGVAPGVVFTSVRIIRNLQAASDAAIADAISWAASWTDVLNNSWGDGPVSQTIYDAFRVAAVEGRQGKGAILVFSAGNDPTFQNGPLTFPASHVSDGIVVAALGHDGALTSYSRTGSNVSVSAFGSHPNLALCNRGTIWTTDISGPTGCNDGGPQGNDENYSSSFVGTSAAAPQVSGTAALILSVFPELTAYQVRIRIIGNADYWGGAQWHTGYGKLNAYRALTSPGTPPPPPPLQTAIIGTGNLPPNQVCTWYADTEGGVPPYTYEWSGVLSGTSQEISGSNVQGYLYLTVGSSDGQTAQGIMYIGLVPDGWC
jgi:subtilisin family serine protease